MRLTLHIGSHKSGSTAIQKFGMIGAVLLSEQSVLYPTGLFPNYPAQHSELAALARPGQADALAAFVDDLATRAEAAGCAEVFLSGEDLCTGVDEAGVGRLAAALSPRFPAIRVVLVLRDKRDYLLSHYNHALRHAPDGINAEAFRARTVFDPAAVMRRWRAAFGADNVLVLPYEAEGGSLIERFYGALFGVVPTPELVAQCALANASIDLFSAYVVNDVLKALPGFDIGAVHGAYHETLGRQRQQLPNIESDAATLLGELFADADWDVGVPARPARQPVPLGAAEAALFLDGLARFLARLVALATPAPESRGEARPPNEQEVIEAYRVILDRRPESATTIERAKGYKNVAALRAALLKSPEYRRRNPGRENLNVVPLDAPPLAVRTTADPTTLARLFAHIGERWTRLGEEKPHWSVLSNAEYASGVDAALEEKFYATGAAERRVLEAILARVGRDGAALGRAFEFGCGLGRMTAQLAQMFQSVIACDISSSHLAAAEAAARVRGLANVAFRKGDATDFGMREPFDFWYSRIVLQHNPPPLIEAILSRALDLLAPSGIAVFQVPTYAVRYAFDIDAYVETMAQNSEIEMHCLPQARVFALAANAGCRVLEVREENSVDIPHYWVSNMFVLEKSR